METNRVNGMTKVIILLFVCVICLSVVSVVPCSAYDETPFTVIENATFTDLTYNQTLIVSFPNGTPAYLMEYSPPVTRVVPLGLDMDFQIKVTIMVSLLVIAGIMVIRAVYDLASWVMAKKV